MINHINLKAFRGSITDFTKINYINQEAATGLCVYLTKFWIITPTKNTFAVALTIQNHNKETTPDKANFSFKIMKPDGTSTTGSTSKSKSSSIAMSGVIIDGFENRDGFTYYALSLNLATPSAFVDYTVTVTFELDGKEYVLIEKGNIYAEYKIYAPTTQPTLTMLKSVSKAKVVDVPDIEEVE